MIWYLNQRFSPDVARELLGLIPAFISADDPRPAAEQIDDKYAHGGGWIPFHGFTREANGDLSYPDDPPAKIIAFTRLRGELVAVHEHAWVSITQEDGSWEVARID